MTGLQLAGVALIAAGIVWIFLVGRPWERDFGVKVAAMPKGWLKDLLDWAKDSLPKRMMPGVFLIVAGVLLFAVGAGTDDTNGTTTSTTTTATTQ